MTEPRKVYVMERAVSDSFQNEPSKAFYYEAYVVTADKEKADHIVSQAPLVTVDKYGWGAAEAQEKQERAIRYKELDFDEVPLRLFYLANGKEWDDIQYITYWEKITKEWIVVVTHPDGRQLTDKFKGKPAVDGQPAPEDIARADIIMDKFITDLRAISAVGKRKKGKRKTPGTF